MVRPHQALRNIGEIDRSCSMGIYGQPSPRGEVEFQRVPPLIVPGVLTWSPNGIKIVEHMHD